MDVIDDNDFDTNHNFLPILNEQNVRIQANRMDAPIAVADANNINENNNMENDVLYGDEGGAIDDNARSHDAYEQDNQDANQSDENQIDSTVNDGDEGNAVTINDAPLLSANYNTRKSKKRKRHYNLNKNKNKWNKPYKRQKSSNNATKPDAENISQNGRNKHTYAKTTKPVFNNKQTLHRGNGLSKFFLPDKRPRKDIIVPPTKFLLGGNISDPLNLNSLQDEAMVSSMSAITPKSSPITTPPKVEVIIPPNICDPLHLLDPVDSIEYEKQLVSPVKIRRLNKQRSRKKKVRKCISSDLMAEGNEAVSGEGVTDSSSTVTSVTIGGAANETVNDTTETIEACADSSSSVAHPEEKARTNRDLHLDLPPINIFGRKRKNSENSGSANVSCGSAASNGCINGGKAKLRRFDSKDKIVSPVIPQPGAWKRPPKVLPTGAPRNRLRTTSASDTDVADDSINKRAEVPAADEPKPVTASASVSSNEHTPELIGIPNPECESSSSTKPIECSEPKATNNDKSIAKQESAKYQYGNYAAQYSGLQSLHNFLDVRLTVFLRHAYLFRDKDILDIGCNVGHMTLAVAQKLHPRSIVGIDIDRNLIARARRNLSLIHLIPDDDCAMRKNQPGTSSMAANAHNESNTSRTSVTTKRPRYHRARDRHDHTHPEYFPVSFPICLGSIPRLHEKSESPSASPAAATATISSQNARVSKPSACDSAGVSSTNETADQMPKSSEDDATDTSSNAFPNNVFFRTLNYAVTEESQTTADKQQYDLILCLSLTKWIHLNFGDAGLKMTFRRMFNQLRPGGKLILEAQNWASYRKRKKLTPTIFKNYKSIEFFPSNFHEYLLSPEVGFSHSYTLGVPRHASKGFYRPIQLYIKGDFTPSQVRWSDAYHPQTPYEPVGQYAHYVDPRRIARPYSSNWTYGRSTHKYTNRDTPHSSGVNQYNTPSYGIGSTSRYYNPLETDNYLPSYDNVLQTRHYCFQSPLYSTVWSPPASGRRSASQTPLFGSIRRVETEDQETVPRHIYLTPRAIIDGSGSSRSMDDSNSASPQTNHVYAIGSNRSVRDADLDTNTSSPKEHVYAFQ